jgi:hypothetical protein
MGARVTWDGLAELRAALRAMPASLRSDAGPIVTEAANGARADMKYPRRTGKLADKLEVTQENGGPFGVTLVVRNRSALAYIFENGTQARHTRLGANRGSMPPGHVFIPAVIRRRRAMYQQLAEMLARHGLIVRGSF